MNGSDTVVTNGSPSAARQYEERKNSELGTWFNNFWMDLKITDIFLTMFTGAIAIYTFMLWRSTDKLWLAGEKQLEIWTRSTEAML